MEVIASIKQVIAKVLAADESGDQEAARSLTLDAKALFVRLRVESRALHADLEATKEGVRASTNALDTHHLQLQNQRYEKSHLHREIQSCELFPTPLAEAIEALLAPAERASPKTKRGGGAAGVAAISAAHQAQMDRFTAEHDERKRLRAKCEDLRVRKKAALATNRRQRQFISALPGRLAAVEKASEPLQEYLSVDASKRVAGLREARSLPDGLRVVYVALSGYCDARARAEEGGARGCVTLAVDVVPSVARVAEAKRARADLAAALPPLPRPQRDEEEDEEVVDAEEGAGATSSAAGALAPTAATATATAQKLAAALLESSTKAVRFAITLRGEGGRPARTFEILFTWLVRLGLVAVRSDALDLVSLYPGDTGTTLPAAAAQTVCSACAECTPALTTPPSAAVARALSVAHGAPLRWAQWLGGDRSCSAVAAAATAQAAFEPSTRATALALIARCVSTAALEPLLLTLSHCPAIVPAPAGLAAVAAVAVKPQTTLVAWKEEESSSSSSHSQDDFTDCVGGRSFRASFKTHGAGTIACSIWLAPEFPLCGARVALSVGKPAKGGTKIEASSSASSSATLRADLLALQADVNSGFGELQRQLALGGHDAVMLLAVQLRLTQARLDAVAAGNGEGSGAARRGRDRRLG